MQSCSTLRKVTFFLLGLYQWEFRHCRFEYESFLRAWFSCTQVVFCLWLCSTAAAPPAVDSDSCNRRWMYWVLEIFMRIFLSDILSLIIVFVVGWRIILVCLFCRLFCLLLKHDLINSAIGTAVDFVAGFWVVNAAFPLNILLSNRWVIWKCRW